MSCRQELTGPAKQNRIATACAACCHALHAKERHVRAPQKGETPGE